MAVRACHPPIDVSECKASARGRRCAAGIASSNTNYRKRNSSKDNHISGCTWVVHGLSHSHTKLSGDVVYLASGFAEELGFIE